VSADHRGQSLVELGLGSVFDRAILRAARHDLR
jgi:hypothetical protein